MTFHYRYRKQITIAMIIIIRKVFIFTQIKTDFYLMNND